MKWAEEDVELLLLYAPLFEKGMSLMELGKHTRNQLIIMNRAMGRLETLRAGREIEMRQQCDKGYVVAGTDAEVYNRYLEEQERIVKRAKPHGEIDSPDSGPDDG